MITNTYITKQTNTKKVYLRVKDVVYRYLELAKNQQFALGKLFQEISKRAIENKQQLTLSKDELYEKVLVIALSPDTSKNENRPV